MMNEKIKEDIRKDALDFKYYLASDENEASYNWWKDKKPRNFIEDMPSKEFQRLHKMSKFAFIKLEKKITYKLSLISIGRAT